MSDCAPPEYQALRPGQPECRPIVQETPANGHLIQYAPLTHMSHSTDAANQGRPQHTDNGKAKVQQQVGAIMGFIGRKCSALRRIGTGADKISIRQAAGTGTTLRTPTGSYRSLAQRPLLVWCLVLALTVAMGSQRANCDGELMVGSPSTSNEPQEVPASVSSDELEQQRQLDEAGELALLAIATAAANSEPLQALASGELNQAHNQDHGQEDRGEQSLGAPNDELAAQDAALLNELLESQSSETAAASKPDDKTSASPPEATQAQSPNSALATQNNQGSLASQIATVGNLLQQIAGSNAGQAMAEQGTTALSEAIVNGVAGTMGVRPTTSTGPRRVRPTVNGQSTNPSVGQQGSIDGGLSYDQDTNSINGFFQLPDFPGLPNFGLNSSNKPSLSSMKPLVLAALKSVPIKLGSVGWKLLQLLAWKKIYKTHHPKSAEIEIEQEIAQTPTTSGKVFDKGMSSGKMGGKQAIEAQFESHMKDKKSALGQMLMMPRPAIVNAHPMGPGGWAFGPPISMMDASASMLYQRHLLPATGAASVQHPATAAAAAAAATAAAIQSQWVQQQHQQQASSAAHGPIGRQPSTDEQNGSGGEQQGRPTNASVLMRKRSSHPASSPNWYASPAHAYAAAAASAAHQAHASRLGALEAAILPNTPEFQHALAGIMYQSLFDNAAAMAVQNAVKLPHPASHPTDFLEPSDTLSDGSLSLMAGAAPGESSPALFDASGWPPTVTSELAPFNFVGANQRADVFDDSPQSAAPTQERQMPVEPAPPRSVEPINVGALPDFDDQPTSAIGSGNHTPFK